MVFVSIKNFILAANRIRIHHTVTKEACTNLLMVHILDVYLKFPWLCASWNVWINVILLPESNYVKLIPYYFFLFLFFPFIYIPVTGIDLPFNLLFWLILILLGTMLEQESETTFTSYFNDWLVMGRNYFCNIVAVAYDGENACL